MLCVKFNKAGSPNWPPSANAAENLTTDSICQCWLLCPSLVTAVAPLVFADHFAVSPIGGLTCLSELSKVQQGRPRAAYWKISMTCYASVIP